MTDEGKDTVKDTGTVKVSTPTDREIAITRVFDAPRRLVFEAWTNPKHVSRWMLGPEGWTMPVCRSTSTLAGRGISPGAVPTAPKWRCTGSIERSRRPSGS